ncbi:MAG: TraB/GumN family protein [Nitrospiria bacterium]
MNISVKRHRFFFLMGCLLWVGCAAPLKNAPLRHRGLVWEVESDHSKVTLLGSIHVAKPSLYPLPRHIEKAFEASDTLVVEADIAQNDAEAKDQGASIIRAGLYPAHHSLTNQLSPTTYGALKSSFESLGMDIHSFHRFKPWVSAFVLTGAQSKKLGFEPEFGIDFHFLKKARGRKKIRELEGLTTQVRHLNAFSSREQEAFLLYTLASMALLETQIEELFSAWSRGDARFIDQMTKASFFSRSALSGVAEKLITRRNALMTAKIETYLREGGNYFVVVGAGHLVGTEGIVQLLQAKGYRVKQSE